MSSIIVNGFNVGTEMTTVILSSNLPGFQSVPIETLGHMKEFKADQENTEVICTPVAYGGLRFHRNIYHDWMGTINLTRFNATLSQMMLLIMQVFQQTGAETYWAFFTLMNNTAAGTQDSFLFTNAVIGKHSLGNFSGTSEVDTSLAFRCQSLTITTTQLA